MASQPGQPTAGNNKKFNWSSFIVILITIAIVISLFWFFFARNNTIKTIDSNEFDTKVTTYMNESPTDRKRYFNKIVATRSTNSIYVEEAEIENNTAVIKEKYNVNLDNARINYWFTPGSTANITLPQDGGYNVLKDLLVVQNMPTNVSRGTITSEPPATRGILSSLFFSLLPIIVLIAFYVFLMRKGGGISDSFLKNSTKNQAQKIISKTRFTDIAGQLEAKEEVMEIVDFLKNPSHYRAAGAEVPKGVLLGGPPGTGKTLIAKATAGEAGVPFFSISGSAFVEMFAGLGAKRVREMFRDIRKEAPAILFIDEIDAIGRKRGSSLSGNDEREQTLNQILTEMDGIQENNGLLIMAATNRIDILDEALLRPGRFDRTITIRNPDIKEREEILKLHAKGKRISQSVDFHNIAKRTPGYSGAQLKNIINEAALLSVRERTHVITLSQIDEAIDRVAAGPSKKHRVITRKEMERVAYHEAGHAVVGLKVAAAQKVQKITIVPRGDAGGYTLMTPKEEKYNYSKSELEAQIISFMGGRASEQIIYGEGEVSTGASDDIVKATRIARAMVTQYGMSGLGPIAYESDLGPQYVGEQRSREYSDSLAEGIDKAVRTLIIESEKKAIEVIKDNRQLLDLIAEQLLNKETIIVEEIDYINKHLKLPTIEIKPEEALSKDEKTLDQLLEEIDSTNDNSENKNNAQEQVDEIENSEENQDKSNNDDDGKQKN